MSYFFLKILAGNIQYICVIILILVGLQTSAVLANDDNSISKIQACGLQDGIYKDKKLEVFGGDMYATSETFIKEGSHLFYPVVFGKEKPQSKEYSYLGQVQTIHLYRYNCITKKPIRISKTNLKSFFRYNYAHILWKNGPYISIAIGWSETSSVTNYLFDTRTRDLVNFENFSWPQKARKEEYTYRYFTYIDDNNVKVDFAVNGSEEIDSFYIDVKKKRMIRQ